MHLTPQSARSPTSPFRYTSNPQPLYEYPSPARSDCRYRSTESLQGPSLYSCPMSGSNNESGGTGTNAHSPTATNNNSWPTTSLRHRDTARSSHSTPNILTANYDPFAPFDPSVTGVSFGHDIYSTTTSEVPTLPLSPVPSAGNTSQRSSFSSAPASEIYTSAASVISYTPRIKMEDHSDYTTDPMMMSSPPISHTGYPAAPLDPSSFYQDQQQIHWQKMDYAPHHELPGISSLPIPQYDRTLESQERGLSARRGSGPVARSRQPRKLTTKDDANYICKVKGCNKMFGRSYNYKAHLETHDSSREYPFPCIQPECTKKFVRKTDLQRHHQSVHMKKRDHKCEYCSRCFARKDTLRRHMEDGCSKRFDIETVDFRPHSYHPHEANPARARASYSQDRQASYGSSNHHYSPAPGSSTSQSDGHDHLTSAPGSYSVHEGMDYSLPGEGQDHISWSH